MFFYATSKPPGLLVALFYPFIPLFYPFIHRLKRIFFALRSRAKKNSKKILVPLQKIVGAADNFLQRHKKNLVDAAGIDQS
ncbi:hypothetical protein [Dictyobacter alpinus]|uniref:hypothetical protein n=1 Tax=Dictyobacter alpinus TaxID=2014873 RepID=UPI000F82A30C|nr:hypothetical protein [Dictyobacter alpinus]